MPGINPQAFRGPVTAVPVVAGTGVRFREDVENNRVIAEADETVLWEDTITVSGHSNVNVTFELSESILNFERIEVYCTSNINYITWHPVSGETGHVVASQVVNESENTEVYIGGAIIVEANSQYKTLRYRCGYGSSYGIAYRGDYWGYGVPYKVVGIRRIASA